MIHNLKPTHCLVNEMNLQKYDVSHQTNLAIPKRSNILLGMILSIHWLLKDDIKILKEKLRIYMKF